MSVEPVTSFVPFVSLDAVTEPAIHRFSVDQYHDMISAGILTENDRVQLIDGYIVAMNPIGPPHAFVVTRMTELLMRLLPAECHCRVQQPITLSASEPEPDVVVARGRTDNFKTRHPSASDVALVVEVADSSVAFDRGEKAKMYALDGIPEYWIVSLTDRTVEVHRSPSTANDDTPARYAKRDVVDATGTLNVVLDGQILGKIRVTEILP